jgi:molecular chaperone HscB
LCELNGVDLAIESNTQMPPAFLMQQMSWREALEEARDAKDLAALEGVESELRAARAQQLADIASLLDDAQFATAGERVRQLMFIEKFGDEVGRAFEALEA